MTLKEIALGTFATLAILGAGISIGTNMDKFRTKPTEEDGQVMVLARGVGEAIGLLRGQYNCPKGSVRSIHLTPISTFVGCANLTGNETVMVTEESGEQIEIPKEMFRPFK